MTKPPIQIVDSQDRLIGHKYRGELDFARDIYRVAALWLANPRGEVLIAQRTTNKDRDPGLWGPAVAGTLDKGETYESNIYKEAEEEIGLTGVNFDAGPHIHITSPRNYFCQLFIATIDRDADSFVLQADEVAAVKWVPESDLVSDVQAHVERYIPNFQRVLDLFTTAN